MLNAVILIIKLLSYIISDDKALPDVKVKMFEVRFFNLRTNAQKDKGITDKESHLSHFQLVFHFCFETEAGSIQKYSSTLHIILLYIT